MYVAQLLGMTDTNLTNLVDIMIVIFYKLSMYPEWKGCCLESWLKFANIFDIHYLWFEYQFRLPKRQPLMRCCDTTTWMYNQCHFINIQTLDLFIQRIFQPFNITFLNNIEDFATASPKECDNHPQKGHGNSQH